MTKIAFQDTYPPDLSHCYGCGKHNENGHQLKTYWLDDQCNTTVSKYTPLAEHTATPGFVYGGVIASLIDCHGTASASAIASKQAGREQDAQSSIRFVTGKLEVNYLAPTPMGVELTLTGSFSEIKERKVIVQIELSAHGKVCVKGEVIAVKMPDTMGKQQ
ncbi:PaaI family thioesterase [Gammaproteobacteria bacterium AS21]